MSEKSAIENESQSRRRFLKLGAALLSTSAITGCRPGSSSGDASIDPKDFAIGVEEAIKKVVKNPTGFRMPGNADLPGARGDRDWPDMSKYDGTKKIPGMCQLCSTICGIIGHVKDDRIIKIEGNPNDPNSRGRLCARGHAGLNHQYHPERLLYPLKRVGERGEGKWKRVSWDEALDEIAAKLKTIRESDHPENFAFHQGRQRSKDALKRFLDAFGTKTQLSHRSLCSGNRRAANLTYLWESDWDLNDVEHSKYILNFGSNAFEAHQGHVPFANRIQNGRFVNGAKMVTFDVRLSNTAGASDEWFAPFPGTDGAIALAMCNVILNEEVFDEDFINNWTTSSVDELKEHLKLQTPAWAEKISGVPAADIRRVALEFAGAAPAATTMCNRGSSAHLNGFYNDRAIGLLNALVGSVGKKGGWCWSPWGGLDPIVKTPQMPPSAKTWNVLEDPPEFPLSNVWRRMRVGEIIYLYLLQGRAKLDAYMTYNLDSPLTWPEESLTREVMCNEELIKFHVCINPFYNETAHYADIVLPWTTYMERWDLDARASYNLRPYVGIRTPMVKPLGEAKDVRDIFPDLARRIGGGMEQWYEEDVETYMEKWAATVPENSTTGKSGLERLLDEGAWENTAIDPYYEPFLKPLPEEKLVDSTTDPETGIITKDGIGIGIMMDGKPVVGFKTPSRKFEVRSVFISQTGLNQDTTELIKSSSMTKTKRRPDQHKPFDVEIDEMPVWLQPVEHRDIDDDHLIMTSFKWNVHNHGRTMNLKWLAEIVHSNPAWLNPKTAAKYGLKDGDWIELTGYFSKMLETSNPNLVSEHYEKDDQGRMIAGRMRVPIVTMPGIHPRAIAMSNSCGHWQYTNVAQGIKAVGTPDEGTDSKKFADPDWQKNMWWEDKSNGQESAWKKNTGNGWNQNRIMPIAPDPITGQQAFHSTVVSLRKI